MSAFSAIESGTLPHAERQRVSALLRISNPQQRLARLVEEARRRPALPPEFRTDRYRVEGCLVRLWFVAEVRDGRCCFRCDSDAVTLKAVIGLLCDLYSGRTAEELAHANSELLSELRILHQLAENRQRTIARVAEKIRLFALQQRQAAA